MPRKRATHTHQYKKVKLKIAYVYRCMLSNCNHYIMPEFIMGKESVCPSCNHEFVIDKYASMRTNPICIDCRKEHPTPLTNSSKPDSNVIADILKRHGVH
jgi:hypothetical protein